MDYYLEDLTRLNGQPKRTIADYVEQNGILVPRRFDSLAEARKSHKAIFVRSEHRQDYDGVSGMLNSFRLSEKAYETRHGGSVEQIKERYFKYSDQNHPNDDYKQYCRFLNLDENQFKTETSFSVWEYLNGLNRTVFADSAIQNRYHIMTNGHYKQKLLINYAVVEEGQVIKQFVSNLPEELIQGLDELIDFYETIRHLERFDPNHCPIIEIQTHKGKNYFLQYHRARDFSPTDFILDRKPEKGEIEVPFVRGATPEQGLNARVVLAYYGVGKCKMTLADHEKGAYDIHNWKIFSELMVRRRDIQMINLHSECISNSSNFNYFLDYKFIQFSCGHTGRSQLFKPRISIVHNMNDIVTDKKEFHRAYKRAAETKQNQCIDMFVISDGRKAYIKRI